MSTLTELPGVLERSLKRRQTPGASVAVLRNNRIVAAEAAGVINLDTGVAATVDTVFQVGSISKPLTASLLMTLVDAGKVSLDVPVVEYLPNFRVADLKISRSVTLRQLLSHQSGIDGDLFVDAGRGDDCIEKLLDMATMVPNLFPIGEKHSYCNLGYVVIGRIIEVIAGQTYDQALRERLFDPLGMDHAVSLPEDTLKFRTAIGHVPGSKKGTWSVTSTPYLSFGQKAAGSTPAMTATDLLKFAQMHLDNGRGIDGTRILKAASVKAMQKRQIALQKHTARAIKHWGLGWMLIDWDGQRLFGHDGATIGQFAYLRVLPEKRLAIALLTNGGDAYGVYRDVFDHLFSGLARIREPEQAPVNNQLTPDFTHYVGRYGNMLQQVEISVGKGSLQAQYSFNGGTKPSRKLPLGFVDKHTLAFVTGDEVQDRVRLLFSEQRNGKMQYLADGMRQLVRID